MVVLLLLYVGCVCCFRRLFVSLLVLLVGCCCCVLLDAGVVDGVADVSCLLAVDGVRCAVFVVCCLWCSAGAAVVCCCCSWCSAGVAVVCRCCCCLLLFILFVVGCI